MKELVSFGYMVAQPPFKVSVNERLAREELDALAKRLQHIRPQTFDRLDWILLESPSTIAAMHVAAL